MTNLFFIGLFYLLAVAVGTKGLRWVGFHCRGAEEKVFAAGCGLGVFAYGTLTFGLLGQLSFWPLALFVLTAGLVTYPEILEQLAQIRKKIKELALPTGWFERCIFTLFVGTFLAVLIGALGPELGNDSLCYHLEDPKNFLRSGRVFYLPFSENSLFPYLMEMLFTLGLALKGPVAAKLFHWLTGLLAAGAVYAFGRKWLSSFYAFLAASIFFLTPGINNQMTTAYIDVGLTLMTFLSYYALYQWVEKKSVKWMALSGAFSGFALSIKYQALFSCLVISLVMLVEGFRDRKNWRPWLISVAAYLLATFVCSFVWYTRSHLHMGTPVYPYFSPDYGGAPYELDLERNGMGKNIEAFLLLFWNFTMYPDVFGGKGNQYGILFLTFLPFLFVVKRNRIVNFLLLVNLAHIGVWFSFRHNLRYLFPAVPLLSLLAAHTVQQLAHGGRRMLWAVSFAAVFILSLNTALAFYHQRDVYRVPFGGESAENFLRRTERSHAFAETVNRLVPATEKILNAEEIRAFYFKPWMIREKIYRRKTRYSQISKDGEEVVEFLRRDGFKYLLSAENQRATEEIGRREPLAIRNLIRDPEFVKRHLTLLAESRFVDTKGTDVRYALYRIQ